VRGELRAAPLLCAAGAAAVLCLGGALVLVSGAAVAAPATHTVTIEALKYDPDPITVNKGDTIVWVNKDPFPHTVTAKGAFDSKEIPAGKSWKYVAKKAGEYSYVCTLHPNMQGKLSVK
jgi:plastocyanin